MNVTVENDTIVDMVDSAITPSDTVETSKAYRDGLWIEGAGDVNVKFASGNTHVFTISSVPYDLKVRAKYVMATSTTATNIFPYRTYR